MSEMSEASIISEPTNGHPPAYVYRALHREASRLGAVLCIPASPWATAGVLRLSGWSVLSVEIKL